MAKISGPSDLAMDFIEIDGPSGKLAVFFPVDLPEGGQLQIVIGTNPLLPPHLRVDVPPGAMVALLDVETAIRVVPPLKDMKLPEGSRAGALDNLNPYGLPLLRPVWIPEGGILNVRVGLNPATQAQPSTPIAPGSVLAILPPEPAKLFRTQFKRAQGQNPYAVTPNGVVR